MGKKSSKKNSFFRGDSNPFNMKINRVKHSITGQKIKGTKGVPVVSRSVDHAKRKELWKKTQLSVQKANQFIDKRLISDTLSLEEQATSRLIKERKRKLKKNIFNLNDDEELTHQGTSLKELTSFRKEESDSEDEEQLNSSFVKQAHFGGFSSDDKTKSHKEVMDQLISDSKQKKYEKQLEQEHNFDLTEKLDEEWKALHSQMSGIKMTKPKENNEKNDPYDVIANELKFDMRGTPSARMKTQEEIEEEEKKLYQKLNEEKKIRMIENVESKTNKMTHESADAIFDDYEVEPISIADNVNNTISKSEDESDYSDSDDSVNLDDEATEHQMKTLSMKKSIGISDKSIPSSIEDLKNLVNVQDASDVSRVIENILNFKVNSKSDTVQAELVSFFGILIEFAFQFMQTKIPGIILPYLHKLAMALPLKTGNKFLEYLDEEQRTFKKMSVQKVKRNCPRNQCLLLLKYSSILYSVSDFRHPVITPAIIFINDILSTPCIMTFPNIVGRLFLCNVLFECIAETKRFAPEALNFLNKVLKLAVPQTAAKDSGRSKLNLSLSTKSYLNTIQNIDLFTCKSLVENDSVKISLIHHTIFLLLKFTIVYPDLPSFKEIFSPVIKLCSQLPISFYPDTLASAVTKLSSHLKSSSVSLQPLVFENKKPKPLKMFEPRFESKFNKKESLSKKFKMLKNVSQKIRKEEKGLVREMRRDVQMIGAEKLRERLESDAERKRKVKELYHELSVQEGDYKKMMKKK